VIALFAVLALVLSGHIVDKTTGQPLPNVTVRSGTSHAKTDAAGHYALRGLHPGRITIVLESDDVPPQSFDFNLKRLPAHLNFQACSTTLDYSCAQPGPPPQPGS